jgi:hypothetical protein
MIEKFKLSHVDMRLGVKRSRLEELTYLYGLQKEKFEETKRNDNYNLLLRTLEQIRKEAKQKHPERRLQFLKTKPKKFPRTWY